MSELQDVFKKAVLSLPPVKKLKTIINELQRKHDELQNKIIDLSEAINKINFELECIKNKIHPNDYLFRYIVDNPAVPDLNSAIDYYFNDGKKSAYMLKSLCEEAFLRPRVSLLEFASGYGRVTRNFDDNYFDVTACDIHNEAIDFISNSFNIKAVLSKTVPEEFDVENNFDVVFALSFFSHIPDETFGRWVNVLFKHVKQGGLLIFTTHGRIANQQTVKIPLTDGYAFIPVSDQNDLSSSDYGTTMSEYSYVKRTCEKFISKAPDIWKEGFWREQDLYIIHK